MGVGFQPGPVVEGAGFDAHAAAGLMIDAGAAIRAERACLDTTAVAFYFERFQNARTQLECGGRDGEAHPEGAARLSLAFGAVAYRKAERLPFDSIPDAAALAAALYHVSRAGSSGVIGMAA